MCGWGSSGTARVVNVVGEGVVVVRLLCAVGVGARCGVTCGVGVGSRSGVTCAVGEGESCHRSVTERKSRLQRPWD